MTQVRASFNRPQLIQLAVGGAGAIAYFAHTLSAVHIGRWTLILIGVLLFPATFVLGRRLGTRNRTRQEPVAVMLVTSLAFAMPVASLSGPRGPGFISSALGLVAVYVLWGALRYEVRDTAAEGLLSNLGWGIGWGAAFAAVFSLIALVIVGIGAAIGSGDLPAIRFILGAYWAGGLLGGAIVGALRPFGGWPLARMFIGVLTAFCIYGAVVIALKLSGDSQFNDTTLRDQLIMAAIAGLVAGPPSALGTSDW